MHLQLSIQYTAGMCLLSFNWQPNSQTPLVMVANRDEFHHRPAKAADFWVDVPHMLAGIDLEAGGTWMGVTTDGYFAALTNVRKMPAPEKSPDQISRGALVKDFLAHRPDAQGYLQNIHKQAHLYEGFNLVLGNKQQCWFLSNRNDHGPQALAPGLYGLSNADLNTPWPKVEYAKSQLQNWLDMQNAPLYSLLNRKETYPEHLQPNTGIGQPWETMLSAPFIVSQAYGTRVSTGLSIGPEIHWQEASFDQTGTLLNLIEHKI